MTAAATGGAETHTLTSAEMPSHTHTQDAHAHGPTSGGFALTGYTAQVGSGVSFAAVNDTAASTANATAANQNTGGGGAHNNLQPYIVVYMWQRTA